MADTTVNTPAGNINISNADTGQTPGSNVNINVLAQTSTPAPGINKSGTTSGSPGHAAHLKNQYLVMCNPA